MRRSSRAAAVPGTAATLLPRACTAPGGKPLSPPRGPAPLVTTPAQPLLRALGKDSQ